MSRLGHRHTAAPNAAKRKCRPRTCRLPSVQSLRQTLDRPGLDKVGEGARLGAKVSGRPSIGTKVAVPSETWPDYDCREMSGRAWQATVVSSTGLTAVVRFTHAKSAAGRAYADVRLPLAGLHLMA